MNPRHVAVLAVAAAALVCARAGAAPSLAAPPAPSPSPPAASLGNLLKGFGVELALPPAWHVYDGDWQGENKSLVLGPEQIENEMIVVSSEPAKRRSLQRFVQDAKIDRPGGHATRICNGTQDGWYLAYDGDVPRNRPGERWGGFLVLAVDAKNAVAVGYTHRAASPENPDLRRAVMNVCLR